MSPDAYATPADWLSVLDEMEALTADATAVGAANAPSRATWSVPTRLGPIPIELRERADRVLAAQRDAIQQLEEMRQSTRAHLAAVRSIPSAQRAGQSVYLDITG